MKVIARMRSDFPTKFGIPRQSGLVEELRSRVVFAPEYRNPEALRGLEGFSHIWLIWQFSQAVREGWSPTVRPPRLGGNERMGVFATRSPFRPNPVGLSCVRLVEIVRKPELELVVAGADLMDGTPVLDIKPYVPYADCRPEAVGPCGWPALRSFWGGCPRGNRRPSWGCWGGTPDPLIKMTPRGCMGWRLLGWRFAFGSVRVS